MAVSADGAEGPGRVSALCRRGSPGRLSLLAASCRSQAGCGERSPLQIPPLLSFAIKKALGVDLVVVKVKKASAELGGISLSTE